MRAARVVREITPKKVHQFPGIQLNPPRKKVAAYARVSTDSEEQLASYEAQVDYYYRHINSNIEWEFVAVYTDEGISATSTKNRDGFKHMIADALCGKIDLILTKSVSRFARNTVDSLITVRELKANGVEVYFEKENIYTMDSKGELLITIMSSLAQEESRSISENTTWGQRKRIADGKISLPYKHFLGFEKGEDGLPQIIEEQAKVVRLIYKLFLEGKTASGITRFLEQKEILSPSGKKNWSSTTIEHILTNEKYKGDAILQKTFTVDFLTKKKKINEGEVPKYYVQNSHPAVVTGEVFDLAQEEIKRRKHIGYVSGAGCFSSKIICGECGSFFGSKVWHSTSKYRRTIWQCNHKYKNGVKCRTPHLYEESIKAAFVDVMNRMIVNKDEILAGYEAIIKGLTETSDLDKEAARLRNESEIIVELIRKNLDANTQKVMDQEEYQARYKALQEQFGTAEALIEEIDQQRRERMTKKNRLTEYFSLIRNRDVLMAEFDEDIWIATIESVIVHSEQKLTFTFKDGRHMKWTV